MGDRANFGMTQTDGNTIFLYSHWGGHQMLAEFALALDKMNQAGRANDEAYGTRIIIDSLTGCVGNDLGFGITVNRIMDNEHKIPVYDFNDKTVTLYADEARTEKVFTMSLDAFIDKFAKHPRPVNFGQFARGRAGNLYIFSN